MGHSADCSNQGTLPTPDRVEPQSHTPRLVFLHTTISIVTGPIWSKIRHRGKESATRGQYESADDIFQCTIYDYTRE